MNFKQYINRETKTIEELSDKNEDITLQRIKNEGFSPYDCIFTSASTENQWYKLYGICEAKTRNIESDHYGEGVLLEVAKFNAIITEVCKFKNNFKNINKTIKPYYLIKYLDVTYLFDLEQVNFGPILFKRLPKTTSTDGVGGYTTRAIWLLDPKDAIYSY